MFFGFIALQFTSFLSFDHSIYATDRFLNYLGEIGWLG